ncbi:hypothetical protein [Halorientalis persicus]|uniref:hypothetical protein n=1 Tax=Halorientalis persicus TaxID=1367881 RepID=UPI0011142AC0|nr:hypothetical protein [Halorientalis persicus]
MSLSNSLWDFNIEFQQRRVNMLPRRGLQRSRVGLRQLGLDHIEIHVAHQPLTPLAIASPQVRYNRHDCQPSPTTITNI